MNIIVRPKDRSNRIIRRAWTVMSGVDLVASGIVYGTLEDGWKAGKEAKSAATSFRWKKEKPCQQEKQP